MPLHPQAQLLIDAAEKAGLPPIEGLSPTEAREHYNERSSRLPTNPLIGEVTDRTIPGPAGDITIRVYRPIDAGPASSDATHTPALMFFHGGGWVIGTIDTHDVVCRALCEATDATVVSVDYRLAPEHVFPAAPDDCSAATRWVAEHGAEIGVDGSRLAVCGDSVGGNLAAVTALDCAHGPKTSAQALVYPCTHASREKVGSLVERAEGYLLTSVGMAWFYDHYAPDDDMRQDPRCSPMLGDLTGQPPAIVLTAEYDPLRDEGAIYANSLSDAGVEVDYFDYAGQVHTFFTQVGVVDASLDAVQRIADFVCAYW